MDVLDEAMAAADVSTGTMAAAAASLPADVDMEQCQGIKRPGDDELDDSTAATRTAARLLGAGALDAVAQQEHYRPSRGILADLRKGRTFFDEQDCSSARKQLERLRPHLILASA